MTELDTTSRVAEAEPAPAPVPRAPDVEDADRTLRWLLLLLASAAVSLLAVWMISPRFEITVPSVVDDWAGISILPEYAADVVRFTNPEAERFRPAAIIWGYLQWNTLGAPEDLLGPNLWNALRIVIMVAGLTLFTALALPVRRGRLELALYVSLASIPAFVVVLVPKFARDLARFGPQEPLLLGGMALGGSLLVLAARRLLDESEPVQVSEVVALALGGSLAWTLGTYQKETSVCVVPILVGITIAGRARLAHWRRLSRARKRALAALGAVIVLPLVHVAVETLLIASRGDLVYGAEVGRGRGLVDGARQLWDWTHEAVPENARLLAYGAVLLTVVASVVRRRIDPIAVGCLVSGALTFLFAGQSGVVATRYYIPIVALFAFAFALSLARLPAVVTTAGVLAVFFSFMPPPGTREEVRAWTDEELGNGALVKEVAALDGSDCTVAAAGLDLETSEALPVLVAVEQPAPTRACGPGEPYLVAGPGEEGATLASACASGRLEALVEAPIGTLHRCSQLRSAPIRLPTGGVVTPERLVAANRLEPAALG